MSLARITEGMPEADKALICNNNMSEIERELMRLGKEIKALREAVKRR